MLMPSSPSVANTFAATPGCDFMPAPTTETLPIVASVGDRADAELARRPARARARAVAEVVARDGEATSRPARPRTRGSFWMIMSTLTLASASAVKMRPATPGLVGDAERA